MFSIKDNKITLEQNELLVQSVLCYLEDKEWDKKTCQGIML